MTKMNNTTAMIDFITEAIHRQAEEDEIEIDGIETFEEAGCMTNDKGIVVRFDDSNKEFEITIVKRN